MAQSHGTVLLLNYNADECASYQQALIDAGFEVVVCIDPLDALRVAVSRRADAVVTRFVHPNCSMNCIEFIQRLKADSRTSSTRIVLTLSLREVWHAADAKSAGADQCLILPSTANEVADVVTQTLNRQSDGISDLRDDSQRAGA